MYGAQLEIGHLRMFRPASARAATPLEGAPPPAPTLRRGPRPAEQRKSSGRTALLSYNPADVEGRRQADCPNCGGPIEFKLGSSRACVCPYCRFSVVRSDGELHSLGKIADLVPTAPFMTVGDSGEVAGHTFQVGGRLQLDHGRGPWDEWYVEFDTGRWGWVAQAQGHVYLTYPQETGSVPDWERLIPGATFSLGAAPGVTFTVTERSGSALLSAEGELPFAAEPMSSGRYVDAESPDGGFATVDFGDGHEPPAVYVGKRYPRSALTLKREALGARPVEKVAAKRLRCPSCGAPVPITIPDQAERLACASCDAILSYAQGDLSFLQQQSPPEYRQLIPLGSRGTLLGEEGLVIGFMVRYVEEDGIKYRWGEYLLHTDAGYRYLVETQGHFLYTRSISTADVRVLAQRAYYQQRTARLFSRGSARVEYVVGEFYYRVMVGDTVASSDYIAPPFMLSQELTPGESSWSLGEYLAPDVVFEGLGLQERPPRPLGVAPAQPNPYHIAAGFRTAAVLIGMLLLTHFALSCGKPRQQLVDLDLDIPASPNPVPTPPAYTKLTPPFELSKGPTTLQIELKSTVNNNWVGVACALINETTGDVRQFYVSAEHWHGGYGEDAYDEGSNSTTTHLGKVEAGSYSMRFLPEWGTGPGSTGFPPRASIHVSSGKRSAGLLIVCMLLLLLPALLRVARSLSFESRRWRDSNVR